MYKAERIAAAMVAVLLTADLGLILIKAQPVDWAGYAPMLLTGAGAIALGLAYRRLQRSEEIAMTAMAAGLFILFTTSASVLYYLLLPVGALRLDPLLLQIDGWLGFSWPDFVNWSATIPGLGWGLGYVYLSSLVQLTLVIMLLGFSGRREHLHQFLLTGLVGTLVTIAIWFAAPSMGPSVLQDIPPDVVERLNLVVGPAYGAELQSLAQNGSEIISPRKVLGLIAFPSFHTVMACMVVWFAAALRPVFPIALLINVAMIPAILIHGGHHLIDVIGGFAVFAVALILARQMLAGERQVRPPLFSRPARP
jgi:hypothetical protein